MRKIVLICLLLSWGLLCALTVETIGGETQLIMEIPYSEFILGKDQSVADYELLWQIKDKSRVVYQVRETKKIVIQKGWEREVYPVFTTVELPNDSYDYFFQMKNKKLGSTIIRKGNVKVSSKMEDVGQVRITAYKDGAAALVRDKWPNPEPDSIMLVFRSNVLPDSMAVIADSSKTVLVPAKRYQHTFAAIPTAWKGTRAYLEIGVGNVHYKRLLLTAVRIGNLNDRYTVKDQMQQLSYILNQNELRSFKRIDPDKEQEAVDRFWKEKDPTPGTDVNEAKNTFEDRVLLADELYTIQSYLPGWKTDRGRIFIKFGPPDEVVENNFPDNGYPYIIWIYYRMNKSYRFYDVGGFGNYELKNNLGD